MASSAHILSPTPLKVQVTLIVVSLLFLAFYPPARGPMLLVPVGPDTSQTVLPLALSGGASLIGQGPLPGSMIVYGDRAALLGMLLSHHILAFSAPFATCAKPVGQVGR